MNLQLISLIEIIGQLARYCKTRIMYLHEDRHSMESTDNDDTNYLIAKYANCDNVQTERL